jgi:hypothetical protein
MSEAINAALKEWAIVCRALADGRQTLLIRKGGIREIKDGFEVTHSRFWLFPTCVHQKEVDLVPAVREEFLGMQAAPPAPGTVPIQLYAEVADVFHVADLDRLRHLTDLHILSWDCVASRFHYRNRPGVHVLLLRVFRRPDPLVVPNESWYDGCVSWVEMAQPISPAGCVPALSDAAFADRAEGIRTTLGSPPDAA